MSPPPTIGIMQGRLSPVSAEGPQFFPKESWQAEFERARLLGFDTIEWLFDLTDYENNPIWSHDGRHAIRHIQSETGIRVTSLCAHYVIQGRPFDTDIRNEKHLAELLAKIVEYAADVGIERIVVPLVEEASLSRATSAAAAGQFIEEGLRRAEACNIDLAFETDQAGPACADFLDSLSSTHARLCFDIGNATSLGQNIVEDGRRLLSSIAEIHIKDRHVGGGSVPLGKGAVRFQAFAAMLKESHCHPPLVLETPVGLDWRASAECNLGFVRKIFALSPDTA